jgi:biotin carboxyl carrier protein
MDRALLRVCICFLLLVGCDGDRIRSDHRAEHTRIDKQGRVVLNAEERSALDLDVTAASLGTLTTSSLRFGKVVARPQDDVLVVAPVTGRLLAPSLSLGAQVAAGDVLAALEPVVENASRASLEAQRRELHGQIEAARAQIESKKVDRARVHALMASGLATDAERADVEAALTSEQARVESLKHASDELGRMTGGRIELRAPVAGVVATLSTEIGSLIAQGSPLARIVRNGPRWVDVAVPPGDPVGNHYRAQGIPDLVDLRLLTRGAVIQPDGTRRDRLEAASDAAASLPPGATVAVDVRSDAQGLLVPQTALVRRGRELLAFVEVAPGTYAPRGVAVGARDPTRAIVTSGIANGERVVTRGAAALLGELGLAGQGSESAKGGETAKRSESAKERE